ncbi:MAG TPA: GPR endopeptidase [Bacillota bacterium]
MRRLTRKRRTPTAASATPGPKGQRPLASPQTDLALEAIDPDAPSDGIRVESEREPGITVTRVRVLNQIGAERIGKPPGTYITIESPELRNRNREVEERVIARLASELQRVTDLPPDAPVLIVGLGNWRATPDALGPRVLEQVLVTRHLENFVPANLRGGLRPVCALTPGVLGITGIETGEIIKGIVDRVRPHTVIAIDALAARSLERIVTTIQIADTGINPGSGVGNRRVAITPESLGVNVVAIGVPTVVHAMTIANDTLDLLLAKYRERKAPASCGELSQAERQRLLGEALTHQFGNLMVTPKEIDLYIHEMARIVAAGINKALHPGLENNDLAAALLS